MIILEDVGLVSPTKTTFSQTLPGTPGVIFSGQERFGYDMDIFMTAGGIFLQPVMVLTPAGFQLATIAESEYSESTMSLLIDWIKRNNPDFNPILARLGKGGGAMDDDDPVWSTFEIN